MPTSLGARLVHAAVTPEPSPPSQGAVVEGVQDGCAPWHKAGKQCLACASLITKYPIVQSMIHHGILPEPGWCFCAWTCFSACAKLWKYLAIIAPSIMCG